MTPHQRLTALVCGVCLFLLIVELVRRRKLKEEFSLLWMITGIGIVALAIWHQLVQWIATAIGAVLPMSALFFFGLIFLILINLHMSVRASALSDKIKDLTQEVALLRDQQSGDQDGEDQR